MAPTPDSTADLPCAVLLGASNVTRGLSVALESARLALGGPVRLAAAVGLGRSYGMASRVCGRGLPAIIDCGLWDELPDAPIHALITDVGNDIMYGAPPATIVDWVGTCARRLQDRGATVAIANIPIESVVTVGPMTFQVVRRLLFAGRDIRREEALDRARDVHERLVDLAREAAIEVVEPDRRWYGLDPIHIRRRDQPRAWRVLLEPWRDAAPPLARPGLRRWLAARTATAHRWTLLGRPRGRAQPARRLADGTTISLY